MSTILLSNSVNIKIYFDFLKTKHQWFHSCSNQDI